MTYTHSDNVLIKDSADEVQLVVQGSASQSESLQQWKDDGGDVLSQVDAEGHLQVGDVDGTIDSLIESHNIEDASKPARGLHTKGILTGTLSSLVSWAVSELGLKGTGGLSALHRALRVQATNENTGAMDSGADVRAGDFEVINIGGNGTSNNLEMSALVAKVNNQSGAILDKAYGLKVEMVDDGSSNEMYAIYTDGGKVRLGDVLELADDSVHAPLSITPRTTAPSTPQVNDIYLHEISAGDYVWRRYNGSAWEDFGASSGSSSSDNVTNQSNVTGVTVTAALNTLDTGKQDDLSGLSIATATVDASDKVLIQDTSDSNNLKTVTAQDIANMASSANASGSIISGVVTFYDIEDDIQDVPLRFSPTGDSIVINATGSSIECGDAGNTEYSVAQSFTPTNGGELTQFTFNISSIVGGATAAIIWEVRADHSGTPGKLMSSGSVTSPALGVNTINTSDLLLYPSNKYWLVLSAPNTPKNNRYMLELSTSSVYANGEVAQSLNAGSIWTVYNDKELNTLITISALPIKDKIAQSFQVSDAQEIAALDLKLRKVGAPSGTLTVRIETDNAGIPSGTLVDAGASATFAESDLDTNYSNVTFTFSNTFTISGATPYWIVLSTDRIASADMVTWAADETVMGYLSGEMKSESLSSWDTEAKDANFAIYAKLESYHVPREVSPNYAIAAPIAGTYRTSSTSYIKVSTQFDLEISTSGNPIRVAFSTARMRQGDGSQQPHYVGVRFDDGTTVSDYTTWWGGMVTKPSGGMEITQTVVFSQLFDMSPGTYTITLIFKKHGTSGGDANILEMIDPIFSAEEIR